MHDLAATKLVLESSLNALPEKTKRITRITVVAGVLADIEQDHLAEHFADMAKGTPAEGAEIIVKHKDAELVCSQCGNKDVYTGKERVKFDCEKCGGLNIVRGGEETYVESIDVEE